MDWKQTAEKLKFQENLSWREVTNTIKETYFKNDTYDAVYERVRGYLRKTNKYKSTNTETDATEKVSISYNAKDGTTEIDRIIEICEADIHTPESILKAHKLDVTKWRILSYKNNLWHSQVQGGTRLVMYQSKIVVKPLENQIISLEDIDKHFTELDRIYKPFQILPSTQQGNLIVEVNIADLHIGRLCWRGDTGNNYDYKIARAICLQIVSDIYNELKGKPIERIKLPLGNDLVNSDTPSKTTTAGTPQDTDIRWQKLIDVTSELMIMVIDTLKEIAPVDIFYVPSNHDEVTTYGIVNTIKAWFRSDQRITVDTSPMTRKYYLYGNTLVGHAHGNNEKPTKGNKLTPSKLASLMPVEAPQMWAKAKYHEFHAAHFHSEHVIEEVNGVIVRRVSSPTAADTWTYESGYIGAVRKAQTFIYDKVNGLIHTINTPIKEVDNG